MAIQARAIPIMPAPALAALCAGVRALLPVLLVVERRWRVAISRISCSGLLNVPAPRVGTIALLTERRVARLALRVLLFAVRVYFTRFNIGFLLAAVVVVMAFLFAVKI